ncbi:MAG TPA: FAD-binding oxidoreductase [Chloroflexota bacterium]|nr:FAD-binding oxidoreductase [Chloroflexota bacterium]
MTDQAILNGRRTTVDEEAIKQLRSGLRGSVLVPGDAAYDEVRQIWNGMIDKRPGVIVRCAGTADVIKTVNLARTNNLLLAVRGAGHNIAGTALCDGGVLCDLSAMRGVWVDPDSRTARVQPGCTLGDVDRETQPFGYVVPGGIVSTTGISGLTLGGGFGWLTRKYGFTTDNLLSADVVTADGRLLKASETSHPDLFWGIRGGGGNFGVITSYEYRVRPLDPTVMAGMVLHPVDQTPRLFDFFREQTANAPDELCLLFLIRIAPPAPFLPESVHGKPVCGIIACYAGSVEEGAAAVKPIKEFGSPLVDLIGPKPFVAHQSMLDSAQPHGRNYYWKSEYFGRIDDGLRDVLVAHGTTFPSPFSSMLFMHLGGAASRIPDDAMATAHRDSQYIINIAAAWEDPRQADGCLGWARDFCQAVRPFGTGSVNLNFLTADEGRDRVLAAYGREKYERLVALKNKYDPTNLFSLNHNVKPSG